MSDIVCASHFSHSLGTSDLQNLGLIHILVVSGTQILLIDRVARLVSSRTSLSSHSFLQIILISACLFIYAALTALQAPLLRALIQLALRRFSARVKLFWRPAQITLVAGLMTLICAPYLGSSLSLQLGWLAALAFSAPMFSRKHAAFSATTFFRQCFLYIVLILPLLPLGVPHPLSILCNWVAAPFLGLVLFPLSAATLAVHALVPVTDFVWKFVLAAITSVSDTLVPFEWKLSLPMIYGWVYLGCLQTAFLFYEREPCFE